MRRGWAAIATSSAICLLACDGTASRPGIDAGAADDGPGARDWLGGAADLAYQDRVTGKATDLPMTADAAPLDPVPPDAALRSDAPRDLVTAPLPAGMAPARRIVPGALALIGAGISACTHQVPASGTGDRWCAFRRAGTAPASTELWVINVTKAMHDRPPACDGTSPDCLRLTSNLWVEESFPGPWQDDAHRFDGDTLIFHAGALSGKDEPYTGPVWAWRPGWPAAWQIAARAFNCYAHYQFPVALCIDDVEYEGFKPIHFDLRAGSIAQPTGSTLPLLERLLMHRSDARAAFRGGFTNDGRAVVYSSPRQGRPTAAPLSVVPLEEIGRGSPREVLPDVTDWMLSSDGSKIYYLTDVKDERGRLTIADFPSGANVRLTPHRTGRYVVLQGLAGEEKGIGFFVEPGGRFLSQYRLIADRNAPDDAITVFSYSELLEDFHLSADHRYTGYAKADRIEGFNGYIARNDGKGQCIINSEQGRPGFEYAFLDHSGLVFWYEESDDDPDVRDGWFADPDGCRGKRRFAAGVGMYIPVRDEGLIFGDELLEEAVTLKYASIEGGRTWPAAGPVKIHERVALPVAVLQPEMNYIVFRVATGSDPDVGLFVFGPIPFAAPSSASRIRQMAQ